MDKFKNLIRIADADLDQRSVDRFNQLLNSGKSDAHYLNQIKACKGDKQLARASTFYQLALENGMDSLASQIKADYPDIYADDETRANDQAAAEAEEKRQAEEKERLEQERLAKHPLTILRKNVEEHHKSPCYGIPDDKVHEYADQLFEELVPSGGPAKTQAGELLRAFNDLMYRWYNDGDWVSAGDGFSGDESFSPRSVSNMKYLTSHGCGQMVIFFDQVVNSQDRTGSPSSQAHRFCLKCERLILNQIVKNDLDKKPNSIDSRSYWRPHGRSRY